MSEDGASLSVEAPWRGPWGGEVLHWKPQKIEYITRHHTDRYIVCKDAQTTYSHILEYNEACTPISSNCTSTVIDP